MTVLRAQAFPTTPLLCKAILAMIAELVAPRPTLSKDHTGELVLVSTIEMSEDCRRVR